MILLRKNNLFFKKFGFIWEFFLKDGVLDGQLAWVVATTELYVSKDRYISVKLSNGSINLGPFQHLPLQPYIGSSDCTLLAVVWDILSNKDKMCHKIMGYGSNAMFLWSEFTIKLKQIIISLPDPSIYLIYTEWRAKRLYVLNITFHNNLMP